MNLTTPGPSGAESQHLSSADWLASGSQGPSASSRSIRVLAGVRISFLSEADAPFCADRCVRVQPSADGRSCAVTPTELFQPPLLVPLDFPFLKENFPVVSGLGDLGGGVGGLEGGAAVFCPSAHLTEWAGRGAEVWGLGPASSRCRPHPAARD